MNRGDPVRVLIVDDEELLRRNLSAFLEDEGFLPLTAASGEEAMQLLVREPADVGIIDIGLPGMNGNTFIERARSAFPAMHFLIHTGSPSYELSGELVNIGLNQEDIFRKPVKDMESIAGAIRQKLSD